MCCVPRRRQRNRFSTLLAPGHVPRVCGEIKRVSLVQGEDRNQTQAVQVLTSDTLESSPSLPKLNNLFAIIHLHDCHESIKYFFIHQIFLQAVFSLFIPSFFLLFRPSASCFISANLHAKNSAKCVIFLQIFHIFLHMNLAHFSVFFAGNCMAIFHIFRAFS